MEWMKARKWQVKTFVMASDNSGQGHKVAFVLDSGVVPISHMDLVQLPFSLLLLCFVYSNWFTDWQSPKVASLHN